MAGDLRMNDHTAHLVGVFDGVGGLPGAQAASAMAADRAAAAWIAAGSGLAALQRLNQAVLRTAGSSTAVLALLHPQQGSADIASVGDGGAYTLDAAGRLQQLTPKDQVDARHLSDHLGWVGCTGHAVRLERCDRLLLCTDGVDGVVDRKTLEAALATSPLDGRAALAALLAEVDDAGRPDDATAILIRRDVG